MSDDIVDIGDPRKNPRLKTLHLVSFTNREEGIQKLPVSMGRTLDISKSGVRLEVFQDIQDGSEMELEIGVREENIVIKGHVVHVAPNADGSSSEIGIEFDEVSDVLARELPI